MDKKIYTSTPVNKSASVVTSQSGCTDTVLMTEKQELYETIQRLSKQLKVIKARLGVRNKTQFMVRIAVVATFRQK